MAVAITQKNPQPLRLDISNANLHITPEQFNRLCIDNPDLKLELTADGQLMPISPDAIEEDRDIVHTLDRHGEPFTLKQQNAPTRTVLRLVAG
jgi:Uma2 family endonuclease